MYLHLGQDSMIRTRDILGVFDLDTTTISRHTRDYLAAAEKSGVVVNVTTELPKSFIVTVEAEGKAARKKRKAVYISQISAATLKKRSGYLEDIRNI
ncbi:MAG: DUF370 domain-containing protein [Ruthenibacterium sp.]